MDQRQSGPPSRGNRSLLEERGHHRSQFGEAPLFATEGEDQHAQLIFMHSDAVAPLQRHRLQNQTFRLGQLTSHQCQHDAIEQVRNCVGRLPETRFKAYQGVELGLDQPDIAALHE